jgi:hypothetical protein
MPPIPLAAAALALSLIQGPQPAPAQSARTVDVTKIGPQAGESLPDFSLKDHTGQQRTLDSLMGTKGLVLVFSRSVVW